MKRILIIMAASAYLFLLAGCDTDASDEVAKDTEISVTLDTTSGSAIPSTFNADIS